MKGYKNHMDKITADPALQDKILEKMRLAQESPRQKQSQTVFRYVGLAACAAVLLLAVWVLPGIFNAPAVPNDISDLESQALIFNTAESMMSASRLPLPGYFSYDISDEQLAIIFPNLDIILHTNIDLEHRSFGATAFYRPDGSLEFISISESVIDYDMRVLHMDIRVAEGHIPKSTMLFYGDGETIYSIVHGVQVKAFIHKSTWAGRAPDSVFSRADFTMGDLNYRVEFSGDNLAQVQERIAEIVNWLIVTGPADLSILADPLIPKLRNEQLTLDAARQDPDFGLFLPTSIPDGFGFSTATRILDNRLNYLIAHFMYDGTQQETQFRHTLMWKVATPTKHDLRHIVSMNDRQKFDVSLYSIPWVDSVPREYFYYFQNPVFLADELTLDLIRTRTQRAYGRGRISEWQTHQFSVLFENVIVQISADGLSPEQIWEMLLGLKQD